VYRKDGTVYGKSIKTGLIVTTGAPVKVVQQEHVAHISQITRLVGFVFGSSEWIGAHDTQQVEDYSKYDIRVCVPAEKIRHRKEQFPRDLQAAFELGKRIASK
jgi:hypothetical protein